MAINRTKRAALARAVTAKKAAPSLGASLIALDTDLANDVRLTWDDDAGKAQPLEWDL